MPKPSRIIELVMFEFVQSFTSMRSTIFIIPYFLFWYLVFANVTVDTLNWLQSGPGLFMASWLLEDQELALQLLIDRSPTLSIYLYVSVAIMPLFILFATNNQFSGDRARGAFRFVLTRCSRNELFLSRFISSLLVALTCILITSCWAAILALLNEEAGLNTLLIFAAQTWLLLAFYSMPFVAFMSMTSALTGTAIGNLFVAMMLYTFLFFLVLWFQADSHYVRFLLPSGVVKFLYNINNDNMLLVPGLLSIYALFYFVCGWIVFSRRDV